MMDASERAIARMIEAINKHLAEKSRTLAEMLKEEFPTIRARDGNEYLIEKKELEFIAKYVDKSDWNRFKIPIVFEMCSIEGKTVIYVRDRMHIEFIKRAFGYDRIMNNNLVLYTYEMAAIRRKLRTASQVFFRVMF